MTILLYSRSPVEIRSTQSGAVIEMTSSALLYAQNVLPFRVPMMVSLKSIFRVFFFILPKVKT